MVTPLQVTCPCSPAAQLRFAPEQLVVEALLVQLTGVPPPQVALALQRASVTLPPGGFPPPVVVPFADGSASEVRKTWSEELACCCESAARTGEAKKPKARAKDSPNTTLFMEISFLEIKLVP